MLPDFCFVRSRVRWVHLNLLFEISDLLAGLPHFYEVSHRDMAGQPKMNGANFGLIFLKLFDLRNLLQLIRHDVLKMRSNHGFQELWRIIVIILADGNVWNVHGEVFDSEFALFDVRNGDSFIPSQPYHTYGYNYHDQAIKRYHEVSSFLSGYGGI